MLPDLLQSLFANLWSIFLVVLFFGGSIFVHELGHFLAARRRGVHVERFSIGFGPPIFSWRRDGVEYRIAWIPLGGYVLLPQLADLGPLEGKSEHTADELPPVSYTSRMIVFVAGAAFNVLFAFLLASVIWLVGQNEDSDYASTRIGYISRTLELPEHVVVPSPAFEAGLKVGDYIRAIDGNPISNWGDVQYVIGLGAGKTADGRREAVFTVERDGRTMDITVHPRLAGEGHDRKVGIASGYELLVQRVTPGSIADRAGFKKDDEVLKLDGTMTINWVTFYEVLDAGAKRTITAEVMRHGQVLSLSIPPHAKVRTMADLGLVPTTGVRLVHPTPMAQISKLIVMTVGTLESLFNRHSDVHASSLSGPIDIVAMFHSAAEAGLIPLLSFTILVNVNLAIFNLLPIPILDGGQMLFATIGKLRRRALPPNFVIAAQSLAGLFLLVLVLYVSVSNIQRRIEQSRIERAEVEASHPQPMPPAAPAKP